MTPPWTNSSEPISILFHDFAEVSFDDPIDEYSFNFGVFGHGFQKGDDGIIPVLWVDPLPLKIDESREISVLMSLFFGLMGEPHIGI